MEIAIPLVVLAGTYIIANDDKKQGNKIKEGIDSTLKTSASTPTSSMQTSSQQNNSSDSSQTTDKNEIGGGRLNKPTNWPTQSKNIMPNEIYANNTYTNSNQTTDAYFIDAQRKIQQFNPPGSVANSSSPQMSLTGNVIDTNSFKHNNMVPFFGGKVKGCGADFNCRESRLDSMQGAGSQHITKKEQPMLFKPEKNLSNLSGAPNVNDFRQSRVNTSMKISNTLPWKQEKVGPGLNVGYNTKSVGGLNAGCGSRNDWLPKSVDDLRVKTNPKNSYSLSGYEGHGASRIKNALTTETHGKIEKNRPDTYYANGPDRWLTTTGANTKHTNQSQQMVQDTNRHNDEFSYFGASSGEKDAPTSRGNYSAPKRTNLPCAPIAPPNATNQNSGELNDYNKKSFENVHNNRSTNSQETVFGGLKGTVSALMAPVLDVLKPTRKEETIENARITGYVGGQVSQAPVFNPADRTKTTNREMTEGKLAGNHLHVTGQQHGGYHVTQPVLKGGQRTSTNTTYTGNAMAADAAAQRSYEAEYRQHNNTYKGNINRPNHGGMQVFNNSYNATIYKSANEYDRQPGHAAAPNSIPSTTTYGKLNGPEYNPRQSSVDENRIDASLLSAFKQNPYTQSLQSWA